jgi:hypothetical protein
LRALLKIIRARIDPVRIIANIANRMVESAGGV